MGTLTRQPKLLPKPSRTEYGCGRVNTCMHIHHSVHIETRMKAACLTRSIRITSYEQICKRNQFNHEITSYGAYLTKVRAQVNAPGSRAPIFKLRRVKIHDTFISRWYWANATLKQARQHDTCLVRMTLLLLITQNE